MFEADTPILSAEHGAVSGARAWQMPVLSWSGEAAVPQPPTAEQLAQIEAAAYEDGYARGLAEGRTEGLSTGEAEAREHARRLSELVQHLSQPLAELDAEVERTMVALAVEVARRLVDRQLQLDPEITAQTVREAIASLSTPPREARVHLNPEDAALLERCLVPPSDVAVWRLVPDAKLRRGDVRVVTENAQVDALLDTRQAGIARALLGEAE